MPVLTLESHTGTRRIFFEPGRSVRRILDNAGVPVRSGCRGQGACGLCRVKIKKGRAGGFTASERLFLSAAHQDAGVRLACQLRPKDDLEIVVLAAGPESVWRPLDSDEDNPFRPDFTAIPPKWEQGVKSPLGAAVDLGTTHIRVCLVDLATGKRLAGRVGPNPQTAMGPAFEASGAGCGWPAEAGAVYRVRQKNGGLEFSVLGDGGPKPICGSGMVDLTACLIRAGKLNRLGNFGPDVLNNGLVLAQNGRRLAVTKKDVDLFQRAKASIAAGLAGVDGSSGHGGKRAGAPFCGRGLWPVFKHRQCPASRAVARHRPRRHPIVPGHGPGRMPDGAGFAPGPWGH